MFTYVFKGTDCTITAPWLSDISQIPDNAKMHISFDA